MQKPETFHLFGGEHCETAALRKVLAHHGRYQSEELLFGLGGGIGFVYRADRRMPTPFVGGRNGAMPHFIRRAAERAGHRLELLTTGSASRAATRLREALRDGPVICYGDIHFLPYFHTPRHFGGHAFVVYRIDEADGIAWISDRGSVPRQVPLEQLALARASRHRPFPPHNAQLRIDPGTAPVTADAVRSALAHCHDALTNPPISNFGLAGMQRFADELERAPASRATPAQVDLLIDTYVNLELAGTGGCAFRRMYRGFLREAATILPADLGEPLGALDRSIARWEVLVDHLLPAEVPALRAVRTGLHAREALFQSGATEPRDSAAGLEQLQQLRAAAAEQLCGDGEWFSRLAGDMKNVWTAETELAAALGRAAA